MLQKIIASHTLPSDALKNYINKYWVSYNPTDEYLDVPIVPDGCSDIIWKNGDVFLSGLMESTHVISIAPKDRYFGIQFKPFALAMLLDADMSHYNDKSIPLVEISHELEQTIIKCIENDASYEKLNDYFEFLYKDKKIDMSLLHAVNMIKQTHGNISVSELTDRLEIHPKKLERLFVHNIGVSVKKFSKIIRFYNIHLVLNEEGLENLSDKVLDKGYFDQAHFNRDFKKLTGVNPSSKLMSILYKTKE